ncbi:MAG: Flp pilus assembly protein CpaB [Rickettsiales bacterium]|nr:Flp pilus assembly protein CpaB [Rickettsiales bacterium]
MRPLVFILIFAIAVGAMALMYNLIAGDKESTQLLQKPQVVEKKVPEKLVYVAKQEIPVGTVIEQGMIDKQTWPQHLVGPSFIVAGDKAPTIVGMVARSHFQPREVILRAKLANPNDPSFLAATLPAGMRAVTVSVNGVTSVAGFVYPGDRVDVLLTHTLISDKEKQEASLSEDEDDDIKGQYEKRVTEILVPDVRVLAIDQYAMAGQQDPKKKKRLPSSVTLELGQLDSQRVRLAEREGEISLALRSLKDKGAAWVRPSGQEDLTRGLPPGNFPQLYDFDVEFSEDMLKRAQKKDDTTKAKISVVRGNKIEELEVEIADEN